MVRLSACCSVRMLRVVTNLFSYVFHVPTFRFRHWRLACGREFLEILTETFFTAG